MITITVVYDKNHELRGVDITGHAGYSEAGSDIVCAAVSALSQTTLLGLLKYGGERIRYTVDEKTGFLSIRVVQATAVLTALLDTLLLGLHEIAQQYPTYVALHS